MTETQKTRKCNLGNPNLKCVPKDMGEIFDCYSGKKAKSMGKKQKRKEYLMTGIFMCLFSYTVIHFQDEEGLETIGYFIVMALLGFFTFVARRMTLANQYDIEYYVCSDGIAEYAYEYDKKFGQVIYRSRAEHRFNEIAYLQRKRGLRTIKVDKWYSKSPVNENVPEYIFEFHLNNGDIIEHAATKEEDEDLLSFLDRAEGVWSDIVFEKLMADRRDTNTPLAFDGSIGGNVRKGYVLVDENGVRVGIDGYEDVLAKEIVATDYEIRIRFEDKPMIQIPKDCFLDIAAFFKALNHFYNIDIDYYFEGDISFK